jgi:hypothetical protein
MVLEALVLACIGVFAAGVIAGVLAVSTAIVRPALHSRTSGACLVP